MAQAEGYKLYASFFYEKNRREYQYGGEKCRY